MDAARTAERLGGNVTIVYRRTQAEMPARVEELHHALEEGIELKVLRAPREFIGDERPTSSATPMLDVMELGPPDASGRRSAGRDRQDRDDAGRPGHHGARQHAEPDHQGLRARPEDHQVGHHRASSRARRRPRSRASIRAATPRAAARPRSSRPATARRRRARSSATFRSPPREIKELVEQRGALHRTRPGARRPSSRRSNWPTASSSSRCIRR